MSSEKTASNIVTVVVDGGEERVDVPVLVTRYMATTVVTPIVTVPVTRVVTSISTSTVSTAETVAREEAEEAVPPEALLGMLDKVKSYAEYAMNVLEENRLTGGEDYKHLKEIMAGILSYKQEVEECLRGGEEVPKYLADKIVEDVTEWKKEIDGILSKVRNGVNPHDLIKKIMNLEDFIAETIKAIDALSVTNAVMGYERDVLVSLRKDLMDLKDEIWRKYGSKNKPVPYNEAYRIEQTLLAIRKRVEGIRNRLMEKYRPIIVEIENGNVAEAFLSLAIKQAEEQADAARALLLAMTPYLTKGVYNQLSNMLDDAKKIIYGVKIGFEQYRADMVPSRDYLERLAFDLLKALSYISTVKAIAMKILGNMTGTDYISKLKDNKLTRDDMMILWLLNGDAEGFRHMYEDFKAVYDYCAHEGFLNYLYDVENGANYDKAVDLCLRSHGVGMPHEVMLFFKRMYDYLDKIKKGEKVEPDMFAKVRWAINDITDWVFFPETLSKKGGEYFLDMAKEVEEKNPYLAPLLKPLYEALGYSLMYGVGPALTGVMMAGLDIITGGLATPFFIGAGLVRFANDLGYYFTDPVAKEEFIKFIEAAKKGDPEALKLIAALALAGAVSALGYYSASKALSRIKLYDKALGIKVNADEYFALKLRDYFIKLAAKAQQKKLYKLAKIFRKMADRYAIKMVSKMGGDVEVKDVTVLTSFDDQGRLHILVIEKGALSGKGKVFESTIDPRTVKYLQSITKMKGDQLKEAFRRLVEKISRNIDDASTKGFIYKHLNDIASAFIKAYERGELSAEALAQILKSIRDAKSITLELLRGAKEKGALVSADRFRIGIKTDDILTFIRVGADGKIKVVPFLIKKRGRLTTEIIPYGKNVSTQDLLEVIAANNLDDAFATMSRLLGGPDQPFLLLSTESAQMLWDNYTRHLIVAPKGAIDFVAGVPKIRWGKKMIDIKDVIYKRMTIISPDGQFMSFHHMILNPATNPQLAELITVMEPYDIYTMIANAIRLYHRGATIKDVASYLKQTIENAIGHPISSGEMQSIIKLAQSLKGISEVNNLRVFPLFLDIDRKSGAISVNIITTTKVLDKIVDQLTPQEAKEILLSFAKKTGEEEITASELSRALQISKDKAEELINKGGKVMPKQVYVLTRYEEKEEGTKSVTKYYDQDIPVTVTQYDDAIVVPKVVQIEKTVLMPFYKEVLVPLEEMQPYEYPPTEQPESLAVGPGAPIPLLPPALPAPREARPGVAPPPKRRAQFEEIEL